MNSQNILEPVNIVKKKNKLILKDRCAIPVIESFSGNQN